MKAPQKSLLKWGKQKWRTSDGSKSEVRSDTCLTQHGRH